MIARAAAILLLASAGAASLASQSTPRPKLVLLLVVDQMRSDYIEWYGKNWTGGMRRLLDQGAWFTDAAYPYLTTVTCAGHATISTGAFPHAHGMIANFWYDRAGARRVSCTDDPSSALVSYAKPTPDHYGPKSLLLPTFADELRAQSATAPRVVSLSLKERTAITLAGRRPDVALWFNDRARGFVTSAAYTTTKTPFVEAFFKSRPIDGDYGKAWTLALPADRYQHADGGLGEVPPAGWDATFPHTLTGRAGSPDAQFYEQWKESPFADAYLAGIAEASIQALGMGQGAGADYLAISFSTLDLVGHDFGPRSHEVQDVLVRLDRTIGDLLRLLDDTIGRDRYVVALSADHGVSLIPDQIVAGGGEGGRVRLEDIRLRLEEALAPLGAGPHVARVEYADVYFSPGVYDRIARDERLRRAVTTAMLSVNGVANVFRAEQLASTSPTSDADLRAARTGYFAGRSGDLVHILKPNWIHVSGTSRTLTTATTHGTRQPYDARVPLVIMGPGIRAGAYAGAATPADIAPTLARLCGIELRHAEGRILLNATVPAKK